MKKMEKLQLNVQKILDKEFNIDFKGYNATEVDYFLDIVLSDFEVVEEIVAELTAQNNSLKSANQQLKNRIEQLEREKLVKENNIRSLEDSSSSNIDILKRLSALEKEVYSRR